MQFKMSQNSLFAILLRSSWWVSFLTAAGIALLGRILFHGDYFSYAVALTLPFIVIGFIAAWRQKDVPGATRIAETVEAVSAMSWREFSALMEKAFERDGFKVTRANGTVDFVLEKEGRTSVVCCKRWKAQSQGIEPLRELEAAREAREARAYGGPVPRAPAIAGPPTGARPRSCGFRPSAKSLSAAKSNMRSRWPPRRRIWRGDSARSMLRPQSKTPSPLPPRPLKLA